MSDTGRSSSIVDAIPESAEIRARIDYLRQEARVLRDLLKVSEHRERLSAKQRQGASDDQ